MHHYLFSLWLLLPMFYYWTQTGVHGQARTYTVAATSLSCGRRYCYRQKMYYQSYRASVQTATSQKYTVKCGFFNWRRCNRHRTIYKTKYVSRRRSLYRSERQCCSGWSGSSCTTHNKYPSLVSCPSNKEVQATSQWTTVSWSDPVFRENCGYSMRVTSSQSGRSARLPWGATWVTYAATSTNNNRQKQCRFRFYVKPPLDHPVIQVPTTGGSAARTLKDGDTEYLEEDLAKTFTCRADNGNPPFNFQWYLGGKDISSQARYRKLSVGRLGLYHAISDLVLVPRLSHHGKDLECRAIKRGRRESVVVKLDVFYNAAPENHYCPNNISVFSSTRTAHVSWRLPEFEDLYGAPLKVRPTQTEGDFAWGTHNMRYEAENEDNGKTSSCVFAITVNPTECATLPVPANGAMLCGEWTTPPTYLCQPVCKDSYDLGWGSCAIDMFLCGATGTWWPSQVSFNCAGNRTSSNLLPSDDHYYSGDCSTASVQSEMKQSFCRVLSRSYFARLGCTPDKLSLHCNGAVFNVDP